MRPQPSDGFVWVQAAGGPALVCGALRPLADHLFTTREWALGSGAGSDDEWAPVAASLGVDLDHRCGFVRFGSAVGFAAPAILPLLARVLERTSLFPTIHLVAVAIQTADCVRS